MISSIISNEEIPILIQATEVVNKKLGIDNSLNIYVNSNTVYMWKDTIKELGESIFPSNFITLVDKLATTLDFMDSEDYSLIKAISVNVSIEYQYTLYKETYDKTIAALQNYQKVKPKILSYLPTYTSSIYDEVIKALPSRHPMKKRLKANAPLFKINDFKNISTPRMQVWDFVINSYMYFQDCLKNNKSLTGGFMFVWVSIYI